MRSKGSTNALSRPVESPMALKAHSTSITNSNIQKSTPHSPMSRLSLQAPKALRRIKLIKNNSKTNSFLTPVRKSIAS